MAALRRQLSAYLAYLVFRTLETVIRMFDVRTMYVVARGAADLVYRFDRRHRERAAEHLRRSFPDYSEPELRSVARDSIRSMAYLVLEAVFTTRKISPGTWRRQIRLRNVGLSIRTLLERKTGLILVTGHFGNWEVLGYTMAVLGFPSVAVARPLNNPYISDYLMAVRGRTGQSILYKLGATATMNDVLAARGALSFIADQDVGRKGLFVDFLGRPASTYRSVGLLAIQYNCPVAVGYGRRLGENYRFEIGIQRVIQPAEWADKEDPLLWITQQYTAALEAAVRRSPEQYVWTHRRWKTRPDGEPPGPDGVA